MLKENRTTLLFLLKFGILFGGLSAAYSAWIDTYNEVPDPMTRWVSGQTVRVMKLFQLDVREELTTNEVSTSILLDGQTSIRVFEGCNGIAVFILFLSFIWAFDSRWKTLIYSVLGVGLIHLTNLIRLSGLTVISVYRPEMMYFTHKYLFTLIIYAVVFGVWVLFVRQAMQHAAASQDGVGSGSEPTDSQEKASAEAS